MHKIYKLMFSVLMIAAIGGLFSACSEDEVGIPVVNYVRVTDPLSADSLLTSGVQGAWVAIVGENLENTVAVWLNDRQAELIPTNVSTNAVLTVLPSRIPEVVNDKLTLVFSNGDTLFHDFKLQVSPPEVTGAINEWPEAGEPLILTGDYFYEPISVTFEGGVEGTVLEVTENLLAVSVPDGAVEGPVTVNTNFGEGVSSFNIWDTRNTLVNYDDLTSDGSWRPGLIEANDGIDGNYVVLRGTLGANQRAEDFTGGGFVMQLWGNTTGRPEGNFYEGNSADYVFKFEVRVVEWYGSYLNVCLSPWSNAGNQEYWGDLNARAIWGPWEESDASVSTEGAWVTVSIPMTEFKYSLVDSGADGLTYPIREAGFDEEAAGSLSFWVVGSPVADDSPVELHIDNLRIVEL